MDIFPTKVCEAAGMQKRPKLLFGGLPVCMSRSTCNIVTTRRMGLEVVSVLDTDWPAASQQRHKTATQSPALLWRSGYDSIEGWPTGAVKKQAQTKSAAVGMSVARLSANTNFILAVAIIFIAPGPITLSHTSHTKYLIASSYVP
eukprot:1088805-Amphidinium_carterae.1